MDNAPSVSLARSLVILSKVKIRSLFPGHCCSSICKFAGVSSNLQLGHAETHLVGQILAFLRLS